jgi:hypothetical protein
MDEHRAGDSGQPNDPEPLMDPEDPAVVAKLVEEMKSRGLFDEIRRELLAEVESSSVNFLSFVALFRYKGPLLLRVSAGNKDD